MASFNFKSRFVSRIEDGSKGGTIRDYRKHPQKLGEPMHLFNGLRQVKPAYRILPPGFDAPPPCVAMYSLIVTTDREVYISADLDLPDAIRQGDARPWTNVVKFSRGDREQLARFDGFDSFAEMMGFWGGRLPFVGHWQCWLKPPIPRLRRLSAPAPAAAAPARPRRNTESSTVSPPADRGRASKPRRKAGSSRSVPARSRAADSTGRAPSAARPAAPRSSSSSGHTPAQSRVGGDPIIERSARA